MWMRRRLVVWILWSCIFSGGGGCRSNSKNNRGVGVGGGICRETQAATTWLRQGDGGGNSDSGHGDYQGSHQENAAGAAASHDSHEGEMSRQQQALDSSRDVVVQKESQTTTTNKTNKKKTYHDPPMDCPSHCWRSNQENETVQNSNDNKNKNKSTTTTMASGASSGGARICYLILVHNERTIEGALHLVRAIRDPRNLILIHVDRKVEHLLLLDEHKKDDDDDEKSNPNSTKQPNWISSIWHELRECTCGSMVRIESVHSVEWGTWSMNLPTLWGLQVAVQDYGGHWDVFINLAGDSLPVYTPNTMAQYLFDVSYNFVTSRSCATGFAPTPVTAFPPWWHKRQHYTSDDTELNFTIHYREYNDHWEGTDHNTLSSSMPLPPLQSKTVTIYFGSQWVILQASFCQWFIQQWTQYPDDTLVRRLADHLQQSGKLMTDETYWATLLMHVDQFRNTLPKFVAVEEDIAATTTVRRSQQAQRGQRQPLIHPQPQPQKRQYLLWNNRTKSHITSIRFERMDEHVPAVEPFTGNWVFWNHPRYDVVVDREPSDDTVVVDVPRPWGPYYLGIYDLKEIRQSGALWVRKVSQHVDANLWHFLPVDQFADIPPIDWPVAGVAVTPKPNWHDYFVYQQPQQRQQQQQPPPPAHGRRRQQRRLAQEEEEQDEDDEEL
ncbi:hypothetical protein ACA910_004607 [Epithemia clementina (nom. ined.)]